MKKTVKAILILALASIVSLVGTGEAAAHEVADVINWVEVERFLVAEIEAETVFGRVKVEWVKEFDEDGNPVYSVKIQTPFFEAEKSLNGEDSAKIRVERVDFPTSAEAKIRAFVGCGDIVIKMSWPGGPYSIGSEIGYSSSGEPLEREKTIEVQDLEFETVKVCGLNLLGEVALEGSLEGEIRIEKVLEIGEPAP